MMNDSSLQQLRDSLARPHEPPDRDRRGEFGAMTLDWLLRHFNEISNEPLGRIPNRTEMEALLREPLPEKAEGFAEVFRQFQERIAPNALLCDHPRFVAYVGLAPTWPSILGEMVCAGTNYFLGTWLAAAAPTQIELLVLDWFRELLGYPPEARGILTSGGSEANLTGLLVAREQVPFEQRPKAVLYVSEQRHGSVDRAGLIAGLRPDQIRPIPGDANFRMSTSTLVAAVRSDRDKGLLPWAVVANAGATNTGTVDPLAEIAHACRQENLWFHVDAAYGWSSVLSVEGKRMLQGIELADSITCDQHKWFGQTYEAGCTLVRDGKRLARTFLIRPDYMLDAEPADDELNFADHGIALTRRFRALKIWMSMKSHGLGWYRTLIERSLQLAAYAQEVLERSPCFEVVSPRQLSILCFRFRPPTSVALKHVDEVNLALIDALHDTGRAYVSSTRLYGRPVLRMCFINWRTTSADVDEIIALLQREGERLLGAA